MQDNPVRVLVVDDLPDIRHALELLLRTNGYVLKRRRDDATALVVRV